MDDPLRRARSALGDAFSAELSGRLARGGRSDEAPLWTAIATAWRALASGEPPGDSRLAELERRARDVKCAEIVLDTASLRGLSHAERNDLDGAVEHARRAWRMARTETLPHSEYLAGLTLARVRRLKGRPYLAARIASALRRFAPPPWHAWIDWELALAGGRSAELLSTTGPARDLKALLDAASAGDRGAFDAATSRLQSLAEGFAPFRGDVQRALVALDPDRNLISAAPPLADWASGRHAFVSPPCGLAGLDDPDDADRTATAVAIVLALPDQPGRRVLRVSRGLALRRAEGRCLDDGQPGRPEAVLCALALAGPSGLEESTLFRSVYGFEYVRALHRGTFDVALHRARARLGDLGELERAEGAMRLRVLGSFVIVDPRSTAEIDDRVLALVARSGEISAREAAQSLGVPLRTVQGSLRDLVESGACLQQRDGRRVVYAVEDTTFQVPTLPGQANTS